MFRKEYKGPVFYRAEGDGSQVGWHYADRRFLPSRKLVSRDGKFYFKRWGDQSHQQKHHQQFAGITPE